MKEAEHRQLMEQKFPDWSGKITYWHVDDLDCAGPEMALPLLEEKVRTLVARLQNVAETEQADVT
jgi:protein-tyrosine phosphatase